MEAAISWRFRHDGNDARGFPPVCFPQALAMAPAHTEEDDLFLHFGGIDCFAEVYLNGRHVGSATTCWWSMTSMSRTP